MAKNLGRKFATMSEDERRLFALVEEEGSRELPTELSFEEPRDEDKRGARSSIRQEVADPEQRDGSSALLDDEQHERAVQEEATRRGTADPDSE
jgi:hypothetical protein